jgi:Flp pilus assembly protein TadG
MLCCIDDVAMFVKQPKLFRLATRAGRIVSDHGRETDGAALLETVIIVPVILILLSGLLEFGTLMFNKLELDTGLRDAARYLARCQDYMNGTPVYGCSTDQAKDIAVYGNTYAGNVVPAGTKARVFGLTIGAVTITLNKFPSGGTCTNVTTTVCVVRVAADFNYAGGPLLGLVGLSPIHVASFHEERVVGW